LAEFAQVARIKNKAAAQKGGSVEKIRKKDWEMIDKNLPKPPHSERKCYICGKRVGNDPGTLLHWPSEDYEGGPVKIFNTMLDQEPFSFWAFKCQWCRAVETKRKKKEAR
jgi:hypothetical protein